MTAYSEYLAVLSKALSMIDNGDTLENVRTFLMVYTSGWNNHPFSFTILNHALSVQENEKSVKKELTNLVLDAFKLWSDNRL